MKLQSSLTINGKRYEQGAEIPWFKVYPFFLFHMLLFGGSGFLMAYFQRSPSILFLYLHGGFAILIYTIFYIAIFGFDEVKWMFINAGLGVLGIYTQVSWILSLFKKDIHSYPVSVHAIPFLYFVLYTFLIRHMILDLAGAREDEAKKKKIEKYYVIGSLLFYVLTYFLEL